MSKSLGNLVWVRELLEVGWTADAIRVCMAGHHYRGSWEYVPGDLEQSAEKAEKLLQAVTISSGTGANLESSVTEAAFQAAMNQDLDTPAALTTLVSLADEILTAAENGRDVAQAQAVLRSRANILGLRLDQPEPEERVTAGWQIHKERFANF